MYKPSAQRVDEKEIILFFIQLSEILTLSEQ